MSSYDQLLHVEEIQKGGGRYSFAVLRAEGGITGQWRCDVCQSDYAHAHTHSGVEECVTAVKRAINEHHRSEHEQTTAS